MVPTVRRHLIAAGLALMVGASVVVANQPGARFPWWRNDQVVEEIGLSTDQCDRIDHIFQSMRAELRQELQELERLESKLSHLIQSDADEAVVIRSIDKVETARAALSKTRSVMYLRMRQVMTPDQRVRFTALQRRWDDEARKRSGTTSQGSSGSGPQKRED
jgi:Spy/CpxP family protein refolding chaperone